MKKILTVIFLTLLCSIKLQSQVQHRVGNLSFSLPKEATKISATSLNVNIKAERRLINIKNIFKINSIFLGVFDLEIGQIPIDILERHKKMQDGIAIEFADLQETKSEIVKINANNVFIYYNNWGNNAGYYFIVLKNDNKQLFGGRLTFAAKPDYATATKILYDLLNSVKWPFINNPQSGKFKRTNCGTGESISESEYIVPAGTYSSSISQPDADNQAKVDVAKNGQDYANKDYVNYCIYYNVSISGNLTKTNCPKGMFGTSSSYTIPAGRYNSEISQSDADALARAEWNVKSKNFGGGSCFYKSKAASRSFQKNNCGFGKTGSFVTFSAAAGAFSSVVSQTDADAQFQKAGQANANAKGTCK